MSFLEMLNIPDCHSNTLANFWGRAKGLWRLLTCMHSFFNCTVKWRSSWNTPILFSRTSVSRSKWETSESIEVLGSLCHSFNLHAFSFSTQNLSRIQSERLSNHISCLLPSVVKLHSFTIRRQQGRHPRIRDSTQHNCWGGGLKWITQLTRSIWFCLTIMSSSWWSSSTSGVKLNKGHECPHCQKHETHDKKGHLLRMVKS